MGSKASLKQKEIKKTIGKTWQENQSISENFSYPDYNRAGNGPNPRLINKNENHYIWL